MKNLFFFILVFMMIGSSGFTQNQKLKKSSSLTMEYSGTSLSGNTVMGSIYPENPDNPDHSLVNDHEKSYRTEIKKIKEKSNANSLNYDDSDSLAGTVNYMIQIGSYTRPLPPTRKLTRHYRIFGRIHEEILAGKYTYLVGPYESLAEAIKRNNELQKKAGIRNSFVVSFRNGVRTARLEGCITGISYIDYVNAKWGNQN